MIRNLKVMGLALVAVFALGAVVASAASAQNGTLTSDGPVTLTGTQTGPTTANALTATFGGIANKVECEKAIYTVHKYNVTPHTFIPNDVSTFTVTPHYGTCKWSAGAASGPATVDMNGCDYVFHLGVTTGGEDEYGLSATVVCPETKKITVTLFTNAAEHTNNKPFCHITIVHKATDYTGLDAKDTTNGTIDITGTVTGIKAEKTGGGVLCPANTDEAAKLDLDVGLTGKNEAGGATSIGISHL